MYVQRLCTLVSSSKAFHSEANFKRSSTQPHVPANRLPLMSRSVTSNDPWNSWTPLMTTAAFISISSHFSSYIMTCPSPAAFILRLTYLLCSILVTVVSTSLCSVKGIELNDTAHYLVGRPRVSGSIFAECVDGIANCYQEEDLVDNPDSPVPCSDVVTKRTIRRLGVVSATRPWPHRVVCFNWTEPSPTNTNELFYRAFKEFRQKADITFIDVKQCKEYFGKKTRVCNDCQTAVSVTSTKRQCYATTGYVAGGVPLLNLEASCVSYPTVLHQFGHIVGLAHEHSHPRRKVVVVREKLKGSKHPVSDYMILRESDGYHSLVPYDPRSIMHYSHGGDILCVPKDPSLNYCDITQTEADKCVVPRPEHCDMKLRDSFGQSQELMASDVAAIRLLYEKEALDPNSARVGVDAPLLRSPPAPTSVVF